MTVKVWLFSKMRYLSFAGIFSILLLMVLPAEADTSLLVKGACYDYTQYDEDTARCMAVTDALGHFALFSGKSIKRYNGSGDLIITFSYLKGGIRITGRNIIKSNNSLGDSEITVYSKNKLLARTGGDIPVCPGVEAMADTAKTLGFRIKEFRKSGSILITELLKED